MLDANQWLHGLVSHTDLAELKASLDVGNMNRSASTAPARIGLLQRTVVATNMRGIFQRNKLLVDRTDIFARR